MRFRTELLFLVPSIGAALVLGTQRDAHGYEAIVTGETLAQGYELRSPWGEPVLARRRFLQTMGLQVYRIGEDDPHTPEGLDVSFRMRLRVDGDLGIQPDSLHRDASGASFVPGLDGVAVDLMYAYADVRGLASNLLSLRLGRQYVVDSLGWWSMDGVLVRTALPIHVAIETYGGFEQRGGLPLSSSRFESEGVWRGNRTGWDDRMYPSMLPAGLAPAWGTTVQSTGVRFFHGAVSYRKVWNTAPATVDLFALSRRGLITTSPSYDRTRVSSERAAATVDVAFPEVATAQGGVVYDLGEALVSSAYGSLDVFPASRWTVGIDADRTVPVFDYDSIWIAFGALPMTTVSGRVGSTFGDDLDVAVSAGGRLLDDETTSWDSLGRVSVRWTRPRMTLGASAMADIGDRGVRRGSDWYGVIALARRFHLQARASLYDWRDEQRPDRAATSFGYVLGGTYLVQRHTRLMMEWEHNVNRLVGNQYRVLASLQVAVMK